MANGNWGGWEPLSVEEIMRDDVKVGTPIAPPQRINIEFTVDPASTPVLFDKIRQVMREMYSYEENRDYLLQMDMTKPQRAFDVFLKKYPTQDANENFNHTASIAIDIAKILPDDVRVGVDYLNAFTKEKINYKDSIIKSVFDRIRGK